MKRAVAPTLVALVLATLIAGPGRPSASPLGYKVNPITFSPSKTTISYPVRDGSGASLAPAMWRVVKGTGNCCENYLAATSAGRLLDMGGTYLNYSDDAGLAWKRVQPLEPLVSAEGGVVQAPNGDILAMTWDPYSGDHVVTFKFEAAESSWYATEMPVHIPFYDRPWLAVIPGPITIAGTTFPYVGVMEGGVGTKGMFAYSVDGLNYVGPTSKQIGASTSTVTSWLTINADASADFYQPHTESLLTPLGNGQALAHRDPLETGCRWRISKPDLSWACHRNPGGSEILDGRMQRDSLGNLHHIAMSSTSFVYRISTNGGQSWTSATFSLPASHQVENWDFKVNATLGFAAVGVHAHKSSGTDQDLVFKVSTASSPSLQRLYFVGLGNKDFSSGFGADFRYDFGNIAILPDGTIATSFVDSLHTQPALAILPGP